MTKGPSPAKPHNHLLARLPKDEFNRLSPLLQPVLLTAKQVLYQLRSPIDYVYFPTNGVVSAMTVMVDGSAIEVTTIGSEGVTGLTAFIGGETSPYKVIVQVSGDGLRMKADVFREEAKRDGPLKKILVLYNTFFAMQVSYSVACNGLHKIEQRCCRWLLMTQDRVGSNVLRLTHAYLAIMLGVRRASVTEVLQLLQKRGMIRIRRGSIELLDRSGLEETSCECYRVVNEEFRRLLD